MVGYPGRKHGRGNLGSEGEGSVGCVECERRRTLGSRAEAWREVGCRNGLVTSALGWQQVARVWVSITRYKGEGESGVPAGGEVGSCLLYTSDAADDPRVV